ncbi:hypothetical protein MLD38_012521 [Melastoma candidum]|uniref:Uncharacterized protein n=1 Tax=Melastoma candidum TaxID=119954 RepID=A0ACB9RAS7_9MYRT|nr:hypothetical protein MLD38_012521 [Melastoma candidum]
MKKRQVVVRKRTEGTTSNSTSSRPSSRVHYGECQKNHAAGIGGYALDGCREFMAGGGEGAEDALTCAACGCHRNFHRREVDTEVYVSINNPLNYSPRTRLSYGFFDSIHNNYVKETKDTTQAD